MAEITQFGNAISASGLFGCSRPEQGQVFAIQCMFERKPPLEMAKTYHVVGNKLVKRSDAMLADLRRAGGKWKWKSLDNPNLQEAVVVWEGEEYQVSYSIDQARAAGYVKEGSNWTRDPAPMLRARLVSRTLRAIAPELVQGVYTPEDLDDEPAQAKAAGNEPRNVTPVERAQAAVDKHRAVEADAVEVVAVTPQPQPQPPIAVSAADDPFTKPAAQSVDYGVVPVGPNKGKAWIDLGRATLERVLANPGPLEPGHISAVKDAMERLPF